MWSWRDGLVVQRSFCSCRRLLASKWWLPVQFQSTLFWPPWAQDMCAIHRHNIQPNHPHMQNKINKKWVLVNAHIVQQWLFPVYTKATKTAPSCSDSIWCLCRHFLALYLPLPHIHICPGNTLGIFMTLTMVHMYWPY